jgi:hypothetical protein
MLDRVAPNAAQTQAITLGADTQYQDAKFVEELRRRKVAPHVSEYTAGACLGKNSLTEAERADPRRPISQRKRKLIERVFGWSKLDRPLRQIKLRGLLRGHFRLTAEFHAPTLRGLHSGAGPFADEAALQLGQYADHLPHGPACRRLGVDLLGEGTEFDAALLEVVEHGDQVAQAAAQAVKFPDNERVAVLQCLEATEQGRALGRGS